MTAPARPATHLLRRRHDLPLSAEDCNAVHHLLADSDAPSTRERCVELLLAAVTGVVVNEVGRLLKTRGGSTFRDGRLASFDELVNEANAHLLEHVIGDFDPDHPGAHWPGYAARRVRSHLQDVLRADEYDGQVSGRELTVLLAVKRLLDADPDVGAAPTAEQIEAAADAYLAESIERRMRDDGLSYDDARERIRKNSGFRVAGDIVEHWRTFTAKHRYQSLDEQLGDDGTTRGELLAGDTHVDDDALAGLEAPSFDELLQGLMSAGVEDLYQEVFERLVDQRLAPERDGGRELGREKVTDAVRDASPEFARLPDAARDRAVANRAKAARNRRTAVQRRAASPHGQWAFLAYELPGQMTGDWPGRT